MSMQSGFGVPGWRPAFDPRKPGTWAAPTPPPRPLPGLGDRPRLNLTPPPAGLDPVGQTSRWVAAARAVEHARPDRLFADPYAAVLAGQEGELCLRMIGPRGLPIVAYLALRTWFLDDMIAKGCQAGIRQCVILAAGMDTRAYRLDWPEGMRVFEVDRPAVLAVKDAILASDGAEPRSERRAIGADLTGPWVSALQQAGFDPQQPAIWLIEGLLMYLDAPDVQTLLATVSDLAVPGSRLGADIPNPPSERGKPEGAVTEQERQLAQRFGTDDPAALFGGHGWQVTVQSPDQVATAVQRPPVLPLAMLDGHVVRNWLVAASR